MATSNSASNPSFVLASVQDLQFEDRQIPQLRDPHDVLVRVQYTGICGSDIHYWQKGQIGPFVVTAPLILGHESSGIVERCGPAVRTLRPGDRVTLEPGTPCPYGLAATPPFDGTLAKYYVLSEDFCYKLPDTVTLEQGALVEPLAVATHLVRQAGSLPGFGLLVCAVARAFGAAQVIAVDIQQARLDFAAEFAATGTFMPVSGASAREDASSLCSMHNPSPGAHAVIDASGAEASINTGLHVLRPGGTYVQGGMGKDEVRFPITTVCTREIDVKGSFRYNEGDYKMAIEFIAKGRVRVEQLVTDTYAFEDAEKAFARVKQGVGIKVLIRGPR
ncbi:hypothetical protein BDW75DRAFT_231978 [Aspergillus navahoensis]